MKLKIVFPTAILGVLIIMIVVSIKYPYKAKLLPLLVALGLAPLLAVQILIEARAMKKRSRFPEKKEASSRISSDRHVKAIAWISSFVFSVYILGFQVGVPLFTLFYLKLHGERWLTTIVCVLLVIGLLYGVFWFSFQMVLYEGLLFS